MTQSCITSADIIGNTSTPNQQHEVGAVLGLVLSHSLEGDCFDSQSLPAESFFVDYILNRLGSENFTVAGKHTPCSEQKAEVVLFFLSIL